MNIKIKALIIANHAAALYGLIYGDARLLFVSLVALLFINKIGGEIGLHRYFCHKSFNTTRIKHYILLSLACLNCFGPPLAWAGVHRKHHAFSDSDRDPHGSQPLWRIWTTFWKPFNIEPKYVSDLVRDRDQLFIYRWYFWIIGSLLLVLALINWQLPIFLISIPSVISFHLAGLVNTVCHHHGDRDFDTKDHSYNNRLVNLITLGSGLHNTHHADPSNWDNRRQAGDIDLPAVIIEKFFMVRETA